MVWPPTWLGPLPVASYPINDPVPDALLLESTFERRLRGVVSILIAHGFKPGEDFAIISGVRDHCKQAALRFANNEAGKPTEVARDSQHFYGCAADIMYLKDIGMSWFDVRRNAKFYKVLDMARKQQNMKPTLSDDPPHVALPDDEFAALKAAGLVYDHDDGSACRKSFMPTQIAKAPPDNKTGELRPRPSHLAVSKHHL